MSKQYLGDGVYIDFDGFQVKLTSENGVEVLDTIYLNADTLGMFLHWVKMNLPKSASALSSGSDRR
jgi:hypothetical protein